MRDVFVLINLYGYYADIFYKVDNYLNAYLISVPTSKKHVLFSFFFVVFFYLCFWFLNTEIPLPPLRGVVPWNLVIKYH